MSGNPHYEPANNRRLLVLNEFAHGGVNDVPNTLAVAQLEATLALAHEQRTANLIAERNDCIHSYYKGNLNGDGILRLKDLTDQIDARLGLK